MPEDKLVCRSEYGTKYGSVRLIQAKGEGVRTLTRGRSTWWSAAAKAIGNYRAHWRRTWAWATRGSRSKDWSVCRSAAQIISEGNSDRRERFTNNGLGCTTRTPFAASTGRNGKGRCLANRQVRTRMSGGVGFLLPISMGSG